MTPHNTTQYVSQCLNGGGAGWRPNTPHPHKKVWDSAEKRRKQKLRQAHKGISAKCLNKAMQMKVKFSRNNANLSQFQVK